jgi:integrase
MAKVRKRTLPSGFARWQAGYIDCAGGRRFRMFDRKAEAEAWLVETRHDVAHGLRAHGNLSPGTKEAGTLWITQRKLPRVHDG